jgi:phytoene synthase
MSSQLARSYRYCERLARKQARHFYPAFRVLPRDQRLAMCALYAFLRVTDDISDNAGQVDDKRAALTVWRGRLGLALTGVYSHRLHAAFHHAVRSHSIPREYFEAVIDGVTMDLAPVCFRAFADLYPYCYRVASVVGLACIHIWGFHREEAKALAERAGIAFQLTNILRDLGEDAGRGRVYLPQEDIDRFGYDTGRLRRGTQDDQFRALMRFEVERARGYYDAAKPLAALLSPEGGAVFEIMSRTYRGLLDTIERRNYDVFSRRVRLSPWRKLGLAAQALPSRLRWR